FIVKPQPPPRAREASRLQRKPGNIGMGVGKTTAWVHRSALTHKRVRQLSGVHYERIDDAGLHETFGPERGDAQVIAVDNVIVCAGQESVRDLVEQLGTDAKAHVIGGADVAAELDAQRAIEQGTRVAAAL